MKRLYWVDSLRLLSIIGVIAIHASSKILAQGNYDILRLTSPYFLERLFRFSVPIFFIISGYVLAHGYTGKFSIKEFYKKRCIKIVPPFLLWSSIYLLYENKFSFHHLNFTRILTGEAGIQLYFIPALFILYLITPLLLRYKNLFTKRVIFLVFLLNLVLLIIDYYIQPLNLLYDPLRVALLNFGLFYFGMISFYHEETLLTWIKERLPYIAITLIVFLYSSYFFTRDLFLSGNQIRYIASQWQPAIFIYSISIWLLGMKYFRNIPENIGRATSRLSNQFFYIYFVHVLFLNLFWKIIGSYLYSKTSSHILESVWFDIASILFICICCFVSGTILTKIMGKWRFFIGLV